MKQETNAKGGERPVRQHDHAETMPLDDAARHCHTWGGETEYPLGISVPPHEYGSERPHPIRGTNSKDLNAWCIEHQT